MKRTAVLFVAAVVVSNLAMAGERALANDPTPQERRACFKFLKTQDVAPENYQVASSTSYSFAHTTHRGGAVEYVFQVEIAKDDGSRQKFVYVTVDQECSSVLAVSAPTDN